MNASKINPLAGVIKTDGDNSEEKNSQQISVGEGGSPRVQQSQDFFDTELATKIQKSGEKAQSLHDRIRSEDPTATETEVWKNVAIAHLAEAKEIDENILIGALRNAFVADDLDTSYLKAFILCIQNRKEVHDALPFYKKWHARTSTNKKELTDQEYFAQLGEDLLINCIKTGTLLDKIFECLQLGYPKSPASILWETMAKLLMKHAKNTPGLSEDEILKYAEYIVACKHNACIK